MAEIKFLRSLAKPLEKLLPRRWVRRYELFLYSAGISFSALEFLVVSLLLSGLVGIIALVLSPVKIYALPVFLGLLLGISFVYPYHLLTRKIEDME